MPTQHSWKQGLWIPGDIINLILSTKKQLREVKWLAVSHVWGQGMQIQELQAQNGFVFTAKFFSLLSVRLILRCKTNVTHQRV